VKLSTTDKRIVQAALVQVVEGDDVLWDDLSEEDKSRAQDLLGLLEVELSEDEDDDDDDEWEVEDSEEEEDEI
jgi:hypothetical protein